jgi:hypothetical protein
MGGLRFAIIVRQPLQNDSWIRLEDGVHRSTENQRKGAKKTKRGKKNRVAPFRKQIFAVITMTANTILSLSDH